VFKPSRWALQAGFGRKRLENYRVVFPRVPRNLGKPAETSATGICRWGVRDLGGGEMPASLSTLKGRESRRVSFFRS